MEEKFDVLNELGEFTGEIATRKECHTKGLWHRAVYAFILDDNKNILLQKRIANNYDGLTEKTGVWNFLQKILEKYV